jgi:hypothetical protein
VHALQQLPALAFERLRLVVVGGRNAGGGVQTRALAFY